MVEINELKSELEKSKARWSVNTRLHDHMKIPKYHLGGSDQEFTIAKKVKAIDFKALLVEPPSNPFLMQRRIANGIISKENLQKENSTGSRILEFAIDKPLSVEAKIPTKVDWRNRFGWNWITTVRDQGGCESCWAFASVALVEAMVRIEHCVWPHSSEGDMHKGFGATACQCGNPGAALDWMKNHGLADVGCFPWPANTAGCTSCGGAGGSSYDSIAYSPTADRSGRTIRIPAYNSIGSVADQKKWLDTVGPIVTYITVWQDFFALGSGVYHKLDMLNSSTPNSVAGGHIMLIVGYDDLNNCWIVKNSWGTGFGSNGYCRIGYGEADIDTYAKIGLAGTNPDPWTKRRMHSGNMIESGNGAHHRNFEMFATAPGGKIQHWWRDNSAAGFPWHAGTQFGSDAAVCPTVTGTTFNRNFEMVYLTSSHRMHHWWFNQSNGTWNDGGVFGPLDARGVPGFIQGNYGAPGNFEVVVRTADSKLNHWWRDGGGWHDGGRFGSNIAYSGASLIQSHYGAKGNFELVAVTNTGELKHFWRDNDHGMVWHSGATFGEGISSPPCMIEGQYGAANEYAVGNFELCVANDGKVEHWWRANNGDGLWRKSAIFGHDVLAVASLVEGSFGFNLEVIVLRTDNKLQHYWRDGQGWHEGVIIGTAAAGVTSAKAEMAEMN